MGGADPVGGSGLRGLADRVEALSGRLQVGAAGADGGTAVRAELPIPRRSVRGTDLAALLLPFATAAGGAIAWVITQLAS